MKLRFIGGPLDGRITETYGARKIYVPAQTFARRTRWWFGKTWRIDAFVYERAGPAGEDVMGPELLGDIEPLRSA